MHRNTNLGSLVSGGPYVIANPANLSSSVDTKPGTKTMIFNGKLSWIFTLCHLKRFTVEFFQEYVLVSCRVTMVVLLQHLI